MIRVDGISRRFGPQILFEDLSWLVARDARIGLVGPNGTGKTTLLRMLARRESPDAGAIHMPPGMQIGYLPQEVESVERGSALGVVLAGFPEIAELEDQLESIEAALAGTAQGDAGAAELTRRYGELRLRFEALEGDRLESRAKAILAGLGVPAENFHRPIETLSGGWRMRVVLARLLIGAPDLLLLDEPTNHLDLEAIDWLESFLRERAAAFVVVSHDRYFLNRMVDEIAELERGRLTVWPGNYDRYIEAREVREQALEKAARQQARDVARIERFIERFRYKNTKAKQVQSRVKALEKLERIETAESSARIHFGLPVPPRSGDVVARIEALDKNFGSRRVYAGANLLLRRGDRLALVGPNGAGKSTLLKLLAGTVAADGGTIELGHNVHAHYYAQHQLDALDPSRSVLAELETVAASGERPRLRKLLGGFLFTGEDVDKPVAVLSGGEKARLALAKMLTRAANLLLLDEPTNHLDLRSREVLEDALNSYEGTLVIVSHDRYFINRIATSVALVGAGRIERFDGDYDSYLERRVATAESESHAGDGADAADERGRRREEKRREAEERNRRYRERRAVEERLEPLEREIAELEARLGEVEARQADPAVYADPALAAAVARDHGEARARLAVLYARWESVAADSAQD